MTTTEPAVRQPTRQVMMNWRTPVYSKDHPDADEHNKILRELILAAEKEDDAAANFGGIDAIKSSEDILLWDHPSIDWVKSLIMEAVNELTIAVLGDAAKEVTPKILAEGWAVVYRSGGSLRPHSHHDCNWSGVYYVDNPTPVGAEGDAGYLQLLDPRPSAVSRQASPGPVRFEPVPGRIVAFPGWLTHQVRSTATGSGLRICIAWNVAYDKAFTRVGTPAGGTL
ncbi:putative 2OG-Fe(II) oxygenase [Nonomuraea sp. NPDC049400]|uniref:putative 2OG-Fe(II) oxygenase n=1 Tax=Nonomuraea sp. NPDC049400 TaxID=3364352 RepID=UPI00378F3AC6